MCRNFYLPIIGWRRHQIKTMGAIYYIGCKNVSLCASLLCPCSIKSYSPAKLAKSVFVLGISDLTTVNSKIKKDSFAFVICYENCFINLTTHRSHRYTDTKWLLTHLCVHAGTDVHTSTPVPSPITQHASSPLY